METQDPRSSPQSDKVLLVQLIAGTRVAWDLFSLDLDLGHHYQIAGTYVAAPQQHGIRPLLTHTATKNTGMYKNGTEHHSNHAKVP